MLTVEFLIFPDNPKSIKCNDSKSLNHLFQSNPAIRIQNNTINVNGFTAGYNVQSGTLKDQKSVYFHIELNCSNTDQIDQFSELLREAKTIIHLINKSPSVLYDGVSLHYAQLAYPKIFEIENLMRKLITKFMLINVGVDWSEQRVPEEVKSSILSTNKEHTYLHNVDFIQLKNFLFSENYPNHRNSLIQKLKAAKKVEELDLTEIQLLIPQSNWERYFSGSLSCTQEELVKKWEALYLLRCQIAHNKNFSKSDYQKVEELCSSTKTILSDAIKKLATIDITEKESNLITETVATSFSYWNGEVLSCWMELERAIFNVYSKVNKQSTHKRNTNDSMSLSDATSFLLRNKNITKDDYDIIVYARDVRYLIRHNTGGIDEEQARMICSLMLSLAGRLYNISDSPPPDKSTELF